MQERKYSVGKQQMAWGDDFIFYARPQSSLQCVNRLRAWSAFTRWSSMTMNKYSIAATNLIWTAVILDSQL